MDQVATSHSANSVLSRPVIALIAFFTLVDLFATQAILPLLAHAYRVSPSSMGVAVNASTIGMAFGAAVVALFGDVAERRTVITVSLVVLTLPTLLLARAPSLEVFALLRILQGLCMATAFTLTLAHLGEVCSRTALAGAFAAYITGNVASNLFGRLIAASTAGAFGLRINFYAFAALNLLGAALAFLTIRRSTQMRSAPLSLRSRLLPLRVVGVPGVGAALAVGFCILFAFIGVFSYVNFVLMGPPIALGMMSLGLVYFVFVPSVLVTPVAGLVVRKAGPRRSLWMGLALALAGLGLVTVPTLASLLSGLALFAVGAFLAQAVATGFVSQAAGERRAAASGLYLASYFTGGLAGAAVLGQVYGHYGWTACVTGAAATLAIAAYAGRHFAPRHVS